MTGVIAETGQRIPVALRAINTLGVVATRRPNPRISAPRAIHRQDHFGLCTHSLEAYGLDATHVTARLRGFRERFSELIEA
jgi:hypothetical protein